MGPIYTRTRYGRAALYQQCQIAWCQQQQRFEELSQSWTDDDEGRPGL
jgi:hypothetical protein